MKPVFYHICFFFMLLFAGVANASWLIEDFKVRGIDADLEANVLGTVQTFKNQPFDYRLEARLLKSVSQAMQAMGYYHSKIAIEPLESQQTLAFTIEAGEPVRWKSVVIEVSGEANQDPNLQKVLAKLPIQVDSVLNHQVYQATKNLLENSLIERGYFDFKWQVHRLEITKRNNDARAVLKLDSGVRYQFGTIQVSKLSKAEKYIQSLAPFTSGTPYSELLLADYNLALNKTPYFKAIKVYPLIASRKNKQVPIRVEAIDKPANSYEVGGGFSTDLGAKARLKWSKPWISEQGHFVDANMFLAERQQTITGSYSIPVDNPNDDLWRVTGGYVLEDELTEGVDNKLWNVQLQRQWLTSGNWIRTAFIRREHETTTQAGSVKKTEMLLPGISYAKKQSRGGVTPIWGQQSLVSLEFASNSLLSSTSLFKAQWEQSWLRRYDLKHWFIARMDLGAIATDDIAEVPFNLRFFAGGDQSIRGFSYQSVAPREDGKILGGKYLVTGSLEYNYQFMPNWRVALFVDSGTATNDFSEKWALGAGFGLRYITPVGPIRLDHAWGLSKESRSTRLSIIIGPEI